jgi:cytochrome c oxidase subunit II
MSLTTTAAVDNAFWFIMAICAVLFVLIVFFTVFFAVRYRRSRNPKVVDSAGNGRLEAAWIVASTVLVMVIFFYGLAGFHVLRTAPAGSLQFEVRGQKWSWLFTYPGGYQDSELVVPQGADIELTMTSPDVIHGFFVPAYRIKQDIVPGMKNHIWFHADKPGSYDILCTQYCGDQHSHMLSHVWVVSADDYTKYVSGAEVDIPGLTS